MKIFFLHVLCELLCTAASNSQWVKRVIQKGIQFTCTTYLSLSLKHDFLHFAIGDKSKLDVYFQNIKVRKKYIFPAYQKVGNIDYILNTKISKCSSLQLSFILSYYLLYLVFNKYLSTCMSHSLDSKYCLSITAVG